MLVCPKVAASPAGRVLVHGVQEVTVDEDQANLAAAGHLRQEGLEQVVARAK